MLDFVPNHMGLDHPWVEEHPEYFITGTELDLARAPKNYTWVKRKRGDLLLAHGRDPYFPGWPDTLQLNYANPATQEAMIGELLKIAGQCDGVRCDMAMLVLPDVFERTWGIRGPAVLAEGDPARARARSRLLLHGRGLLGPGMDAPAAGIRLRLRQAALRPPPRTATPGRCASISTRAWITRTSWPASWRTTTSRGPRRRFLREVHEAAAVITFLSPGLRFFHQGQFEGRKKRISPHLCPRPGRARRSGTRVSSTTGCLTVLRQPVVRDGQWQLLECAPAWDGNWTNDCFVAFAWQGPTESGCWWP